MQCEIGIGGNHGLEGGEMKSFNSFQQDKSCFDIKVASIPGDPWHKHRGCEVSDKYEDMEGI